jgi:hypothetical protein
LKQQISWEWTLLIHIWICSALPRASARSEKIESARTIGEVLDRALAHPGPTFLIIDREP